MSIIKKPGESNTISGENELVDGQNNFIPHSVGLRIKTLNPNEIDIENIQADRYRGHPEIYRSYHKDVGDKNNLQLDEMII